MSNDLFGVVAVVVVLGVAGVALGPAFADSADRAAVVNESISVNYQTEQSVSQHSIDYSGTVTVRNASGSELTAGDDYRWDSSVGNVTWLNTTRTSSGESASISYGYAAPSEQQQTRADTLGALSRVVGLVLPFLLAVGYVIREVL